MTQIYGEITAVVSATPGRGRQRRMHAGQIVAPIGPISEFIETKVIENRSNGHMLQ